MVQSRRNWFVGLLMILIVILSWISSSFLLNQVFEEDGYNKPFLITYLNVSSFILYLLPSLKNLLFDGKKNKLNNDSHDEKDSDVSKQSDHLTPLLPEKIIKPLSVKDTVKLSALFCVLWFTANFSTNASLSYTSVTSQTILSSTSSFFTLFIGAILHVESVNSKKLLGLLISFIGIICVTESDSISHETNFSNTQIVIGNSLALIGALVYGLYSTFLKKSIKDESRINIKLFFGFVGLFTLFTLWPILFILHYTGIETFELPKTSRIVYLLLVNGLITFISDFCWARAILLTSPLTVTVGLSLTIPFAMMGDILFKGKLITVGYLVGAIMVLTSFALINHEEDDAELAKALSISIDDLENQTNDTIYNSF